MGKNHKLYKLMPQAYMQKHQIRYVHVEYSEKNHLCTYIHKHTYICKFYLRRTFS